MNDTFKLCEAVGFDDAPTLLGEVEAFIAQSENNIQIDFGALQVTSSLLVAMMMCWYRNAELEEKKICFVNLPAGVLKIVEISGLGLTLPIKHQSREADHCE